MKICFKQPKRYGCSFFALANFFNDEKYLEYIIEDRGGFLEQNNRAVRENFPGHWLTTYVAVHSGLAVQNRFIDVSFFEVDRTVLPEEIIENNFRPFFVTIKKAVVHHAVLLIQRLKDGQLFLFDSLKDQPEEHSPETFVLSYWVTEIHLIENEELAELCTWGSPAMFLSFNYNAYPHLKPQL